MTYYRRSFIVGAMFKQTVIGLTCFLLGLVGGMAAMVNAEPTLRLEATVGISKHQLSSEGTWWYEGFDTNTKTLTGSYALGLLWTPLKSGNWKIGLRGGYADLGTVKASNSFPIYEDRSQADFRVNPNCNRSTLEGCAGRFSGTGETKGWYVGPAFERDYGGGVGIGIELGAFFYKANWVAREVVGVDENGGEFKHEIFDGFVWDNARTKAVTPYIGGNVRWNYLYLMARAYTDVRASRQDINSGFVGMTSGPVWTVMVGASVPLN